MKVLGTGSLSLLKINRRNEVLLLLSHSFCSIFYHGIQDVPGDCARLREDFVS